MGNKWTPPINPAMKNALRKAVPDLVETVTSDKAVSSKTNENHRKYPSHQKSQHSFEKYPKVKKANDSYTENENAALAIASNLAQSRIQGLIGIANTQKYDHFISQIKEQIQNAYKFAQFDANNDFTNSVLQRDGWGDMQAQLKKLWQRIMNVMPQSRRPYYNTHEQTFLMMEMVLLVNRLRNHFCHMSRMGDPFDVTGKAKFTDFIERLYNEAQNKTETRSVSPVVEKKLIANGTQGNNTNFTLTPFYGVVFVLNLFLSKSQAERLIQQISEFKKKAPKAHNVAAGALQPLNRRLKTMLCAYAQRDGYSETQFDEKSALAREIIGYLTLPPIESKAGQDALNKWQSQLQRGDETVATPIFRRTSKVRSYIHQTLDSLKLLTELKFWGSMEKREEINNAEGEIEYSEWMAQEGTPTQSKDSSEREKYQKLMSYGRNVNLSANERFIYDMSDGNLRFEITYNGNTQTGVLRLRDWLNFVFIVLTDQAKVPDLLQYISEWLTTYQNSLTGKLEQHLLPHYPKQLQNQLTGQTSNLKHRIKQRLKSRKQWNQRCQALLQDEELPVHEQIHEILHEFIRPLNKEGRDTVRRGEYAYLHKLLLQYKGDATKDEITQLKKQGDKANNQAFTLLDKLSAKGYFWKYIHEKYPPELVTGNKTHPIWEACIQKGERGSNVASLNSLCRSILWRQGQDIDAAEKHVNTANEQELKNMAHTWQVGLQQESANQNDEKEYRKSGVEAAKHHARQYSVLPAAWVQQALNEQKAQHSIGNSQTHDLSPKDRSVNWADKIRRYPTCLKLQPEFYQVELLYPEIDQKLAQDQSIQFLSSNPKKKKQWKSTVKALNDWQTQDQLCLLMAERLAEQAKLHLEGGKQVNEFAEQEPNVVFEGANHRGEKVNITLKLSRSTQSTRQWFAWSKAGLKRALCWHYPNNSTVQAQDIVTLISNYQSHYLSIAQTILEFERRFYETPRGIDLKNTTASQQKGYISFKELLSQSGIESKQHKSMSALRNAVLHDRVPLQKDLPDLLENQRGDTIKIEEIGQAQLLLLKTHHFAGKDEHQC